VTLRRRELLAAAAGMLGGCAPLRYAYPAEPSESQFVLPPSRCEAPTPGGPEGPFYRPRTPRRRYLHDGGGERIVLEGRVLDVRCRPLANAVIDFWQADERGVYDRDGQRYRGHQFTSRDGLYRLVTVKPGVESVLGVTRTPHLHAKVQARGTDLLTTQIYFAEEAARNADDAFFDPRMAVRLDRTGRVTRARLDLVLT